MGALEAGVGQAVRLGTPDLAASTKRCVSFQ